MYPRLRTVSLAFVAASALALSGALPIPFASQPALAQGNGGSHGGGGGSHSGGSHGGGGGGGNSSANSNSSGGGSQASTAPGHNKTNVQFASAGSQNSSGTPKAVIRQYVLLTGLKQGDVARTLKSWNSLNRNPRAFANALKNPSSLPAVQITYIRDNMLANDALKTFEAFGGDPNNPPTQDQFDAAQAYLTAEQTLGDLDPTLVQAAAPGTYPDDVVAAADTVLGYTGPDPQTVVNQYTAWTDYQTAEATATDAFTAASVSYRNADQTTLDALRKLVDDIVKTEGLDTMVSNL